MHRASLTRTRRPVSETLSTLRVERNRLQRVLTDVFTAMYPVPTGPVGVIDYTDLPAHVASLRDERDRLQTDLAVERQNRKVMEGYYEAAIEVAQQAEAERDRLRAVVDALVDFRTKQDAALHADAEPEVEIGLTDIAFDAWRGVTALLDQLDGSEDMGDE